MTSIEEVNSQGSQRPYTTGDNGRFASQSLGRFFAQQTSAMDEKTVNNIWRGFGSYVAKQMRNGKGISVPRFGNFTFTAPNVDLAGTTNPDLRDKQNRNPVFIVGKDFVSGVELRTGISYPGGVRPFDVKGSNGIIPKVKINYTEVALLCSQNKDISKNACEQVFRFLSDKTRRGEQVTMDIPFVGTFKIQHGVAAINFGGDLSHDTKGMTAKNHYVNKLFASSVNKLNLQIADQDHMKANSQTGMGGSLRVTWKGEDWLKNRLNIDLDDMISKSGNYPEATQTVPNTRIRPRMHTTQSQGVMNRYASSKPVDNRNKSWGLNQSSGLTEQNKAVFDKIVDTKSNGPGVKRPMSAASRVTGSSRITSVPELGRMKLMIIANDVYKNRAAITEMMQQVKTSMRDVLSSSQICSIFKKTGIFIEISNIKALLRELGFNWSGPACTMVDLFNSCQNFIYGKTQQEEMQNTYFSAQNSMPSQQPEVRGSTYNPNKRPHQGQVETRPLEDSLSMIKDLFYSTGKTLYEIYTEAKLGQNIDYEGFRKVINEYSDSQVNEAEIKAVFRHICKFKKEMSFQEFQTAFNWELISGGDWETKCIRQIREWMFKNNLSSETTFEMFLKNVNKISQRRLTRVDFHKALNICNLKFSAPEIDGIFFLLDLNKDGELDLDEWKSRIYEDCLNPLQMLREVVATNKLTTDDLLFKMKLRIWDGPLEFPMLCEYLRRLDPTLSEPQLRHLFKSLKNNDNKVDVTSLLRNLCGQEHETVDYRNKVFRQIYSEIHPDKEAKLLQALEEADPLNDGKVEPQGLKIALKKVLNNVDDDSLDRFIRFLDKDKSGKVNYMEFMQRMTDVSNKDHNPFKSVVQRLSYFITSNNQTVRQVLKRLAAQKSADDSGPSKEAIPVPIFAQFLKSKIDKKRDIGQLEKFANYMDIDKDGYLSEVDVQTCLNNLNSEAFFKNNGEALVTSTFSSAKKFYPMEEKLSDERTNEIAKQIRSALIGQKIAYREAFNRFDSNKDGFLSFGEFSTGLDKVMTLSIPIKEKLFAIMDKHKIGLIDYPNFLEVIQQSSANLKKNSHVSEDNFDWENQIIENIQAWISREKITVEEAFKCFDKDFDGFINKSDLKWALVHILDVQPEDIYPTKVDRLFRLMDFYKTGKIQPSDFQRIVINENPYSTAGATGTNQFNRSFGGGFMQTSTFDWKLSAIQQMGLYLSKHYNSLQQSYEIISEHLQQLSFEQFKQFVEKNNCLHGFNMTNSLIQKLFSELDPHKKGYLSEQDWINAFQSFKQNDQIFIELKNAIQCAFSDVDSAFDFFLTFKTQDQANKSITHADFERAVNNLTSDRFRKEEVESLWRSIQDNNKSYVDKYQFRVHFENLKYIGNSTVKNIKQIPIGARTTIQTHSSSSSQWDTDIFEKVRQIIRTSTKSFEEIFAEFDADGNGTLSQTEFRNAIRKLIIGISSREIDKMMEKIDLNGDGKIDWREFIAKFKKSELDERLKERSRDKMARIKELMLLHMTTPNDAFRFFDVSKLGKLTYQEFGKMIVKLHELAGEKPPAYPVIKDLFDTIDIRKDGIIDHHEWQQTFGNVIEGNNQLSIKPTPLHMWENSREFDQFGAMFSRNRRLLKEQFDRVSRGSKTITFGQVKVAMDAFLNRHFRGLSDDKLMCALRPAEVQAAAATNPGTQYDYRKLIQIYKSRYAGPQT